MFLESLVQLTLFHKQPGPPLELYSLRVLLNTVLPEPRPALNGTFGHRKPERNAGGSIAILTIHIHT